MRPLISFAILAALFIAPQTRAEDAADFRDNGIAALKESQSNPRAIVDAARHFVKAADLYAAAGNDEKTVEMNSFLYWCKKKMTMQDIDAFVQGGESAVSIKLTAVEKLAPQADDAQKYFDRAEKFATGHPDEHLLIAIRYFEVADRFKGSDASLKAQDRSLKEQLQDKAAAPKTTTPPIAVAAPKLAPASGGSQPVPPPEKIKEAEKTIKELFKAEYVKTDARSRFALSEKLTQQAAENKGDPPSEYVLLHEARDLAVAAGDVRLSVGSQKRLCRAFSFDFATILADLRHLESIAKTEAPATALAALFSKAAEAALEADNFDQAVRFNSHVDDLLPLLKDAALKARLKSEIAYVQALKRDSVPALAAVKTLSTNADDPDANLAAGKFALERGRFEQAFALLAKGKDVALAAVAKRELTPPTEALEQVKMGDEWFERGQKESVGYLRIPMLERASFWYGNALPVISGLAKVKVEEHIEKLQTAAIANGLLPKVDLLALLNSQKGKLVCRGKWQVTQDYCVSDNGVRGFVQIPYHPPVEYDFNAEFSLQSAGIVVFVLPGPATQFVFQIGWEKCVGFELVSGKRSNENETTKPFLLIPNRRYKTAIKVRKTGIRAFIDDQLVSELRTDFRNLSVYFQWAIPDSQALAVTNDTAIATYYSLSIVEVTGKGEIIKQ